MVSILLDVPLGSDFNLIGLCIRQHWMKMRTSPGKRRKSILRRCAVEVYLMHWQKSNIWESVNDERKWWWAGNEYLMYYEYGAAEVSIIDT